MNRTYLATTGISEIWDKNDDLLLLGPWCAYGVNNKDLVGARQYKLLPSPWKPAYKIKEAADYCEELYERLLPELSEKLNTLHRLSYPQQSWRILIGPWLLHFIGIFYERHKRLEEAFRSHPDSYTHVLSMDDCDISVFDTFDLIVDQAKDDSYNLKLFSLIASDCYPQNIKETGDDFIYKPNIEKFNNTLKGKVLNHLLKTLNRNFAAGIILSDMYPLSLHGSLRLKFKSPPGLFNLVNFSNPERGSLSGELSKDKRNKLILRQEESGFTSLLFKLIPYAIPKCYIENFASYQRCTINAASTKVIGSAVGWFFNESFKFFCARQSAEKKICRIEFQHGSNYGMSLSVPVEKVSKEKDIFYSWGWPRPGQEKWGLVKPLPDPYLSQLRDSYRYTLDKIIFIGTSFPRYHYRFQSMLMPDDMPKYYEDKISFLRGLDSNLLNKLLYRPYVEYGWQEKGMLKEAGFSFEFYTGKRLVSLMQKARLVVIDHAHTSFLEALVINVPCIFYWDHEVYLMRQEAEEYFKLLRDVGILYKDSLSAAKKANEIYSEPWFWWQSRDIQEARNKFCKRFAYTRKDWMKIWLEEFKNLN